MHFINCQLNQFKALVGNKKVVIFGAGHAGTTLAGDIMEELGLNGEIDFFVDNHLFGTNIHVNKKEYAIRHPKVLKEAKDIVVLICNRNNSLDIYNQIVDMNISDEIFVLNLYFMLAVSCGITTEDYKKRLIENAHLPLIPKKIHTFWFSGEKIPDAYLRCMETWNEFCPEYQIVMWDLNSYNSKSLFFKQAINNRKWAFASDYARVDVLNREGGIYMDMDVEVLKSFNNLLGCRAFFSFDNTNSIGLEVFGTRKNNKLLQQILDFYNEQKFDPQHCIDYVQPLFLRNVFKKNGVRPNGESQCVDDMFFCARNFFNPMDSMWYETECLDSNTYTIHRNNCLWQDAKKRNDGTEQAKLLRTYLEEF